MRRRILWLAGGCVIIVMFASVLGTRRRYQPGPVMEAHAQLGNRCAACHEPWHGVTNQGCISCHGDYADNNPHGDFDVNDHKWGLLPGRKLVAFDHNLECLTCHTEHRGRFVDVKAEAAFACAYCHEHPSIDKVAKHVVPVMVRQKTPKHLFTNVFSHFEHEGLISLEDPPRPGNCLACHYVRITPASEPAMMDIKWSGCAGSDCHLKPQDQYLQLPASLGPSPKLIPYSGAVKFRYVNAVFTHSSEHLRFGCDGCHFLMLKSRKPDDAASLAIKQCFTCHAHQPEPATAQTARAAALILSGVAEAAQPALQVDTRVVQCGECHLFHTYGPIPTTDFPAQAPKFPPHAKPGLILMAYLPALTSAHGGLALRIKPVEFAPWWIGCGALAVLGFGIFAYIRLLPERPAVRTTRSDVAPQRMRETPRLDDTYQASLRGLYIIGEAGGTASINFAMRSGRQVITAIGGQLKRAKAPVAPDVYDVAIIGCGPAGLSATAAAKAAGLNYVTLEKMTPASTIRSYPRGKFVQATPIDLAEYGSFFLEGDDSKEGLIATWEKVVAQAGLMINDRQEVVDVKWIAPHFLIKTANNDTFEARFVVLAIGVRGNPRRLGMAGETPERVFYNLIEPEEFKNKNILVVGGGNAGAEVVQALAAPELGNKLSYSFREASLTTVTRENAEKLSALQQINAVTLYPASSLKEIRQAKIVLEPVKAKAGAAQAAGLASEELDNDVIFAMIGAELPTRFLKAIGIRMTAKGR
jgi:thioredoxin reductase (NADPH)